MDVKTFRLSLAVAAFAVLQFFVLLWQPTRQVRLHQRHLLRAVEKRDWPKVSGFIGAKYRDRWAHDKENVIADATQVFSQFALCSIQADERAIDVADGRGAIVQKLGLGGIGGPFADLAKQHVNALTEPFTFKWHRQSWKPWDWVLVEADQPQLVLGRLPAF